MGVVCSAAQQLGSPRVQSGIAGLSYFASFLLGFIAFVYIPFAVKLESLAATIGTLKKSNEVLLRFAVLVDIFLILAELSMISAINSLFSRAQPRLAFMAVLVRFTIVAMICGGILTYGLVHVLIVSKEIWVKSGNAHVRENLLVLLIQLHAQAVYPMECFSSIYCFILGCLIFVGGFVPHRYGVFMIVAGLGHTINSFGCLVYPVESLSPSSFLTTFTSEGLFFFWLLWWGVDDMKWHKQTFKELTFKEAELDSLDSVSHV